MTTVRILHILARLDRGGTETWLVNVLRRWDRGECACDFVVLNGPLGAYESEVESLGARIFRCPRPTSPWAFGRSLTKVLRSCGPYDVVHSHIDPCGYPLHWARMEHIPVRIAHAHNPGAELRSHPNWIRQALWGWTQSMIVRNATAGLATGRAAGQSLFGRIRSPNWSWRVLHCGVDLEPLRRATRTREQMLAEFDLPQGSQVLLHVGKFCQAGQKNQEFFLQMLVETRRMHGLAFGLLVGDGPRRKAVEGLAYRLKLSQFVRFLGSRQDVPELLQSLADVFVFPSRFEGLGLAAVEAQAAGRPCVVSDAVPDEAVVVPELVERLPLEAGPAAWAARISARLHSPLPLEPSVSWGRVAESSFNIAHAAETLQSYYRQFFKG